jgi:thiamine biosynthesis lipoprotein
MTAEPVEGVPGRCHVEHVMGMPISIDIRDPSLSPADLDAALARCVGWFHWVDEVFSTYKPESAISRLGRGELALAGCPPEVSQVLDRCEQLRAETGGYFDVMAGGTLDPSGLVKGWAVERAAALLIEAGSQRHCINAAGDVTVVGGAEPSRPWRVGIAHPLVTRALCTVVALTDGAVATSGTSERGFHVFVPQTGQPATALASVTVVGPHLGDADAYATAALAMGLDAPSWLEALPNHEAYVVDAIGHMWASSAFGDYLVDV